MKSSGVQRKRNLQIPGNVSNPPIKIHRHSISPPTAALWLPLEILPSTSTTPETTPLKGACPAKIDQDTPLSGACPASIPNENQEPVTPKRPSWRKSSRPGAASSVFESARQELISISPAYNDDDVQLSNRPISQCALSRYAPSKKSRPPISTPAPIQANTAALAPAPVSAHPPPLFAHPAPANFPASPSLPAYFPVVPPHFPVPPPIISSTSLPLRPRCATRDNPNPFASRFPATAPVFAAHIARIANTTLPSSASISPQIIPLPSPSLHPPTTRTRKLFTVKEEEVCCEELDAEVAEIAM